MAETKDGFEQLHRVSQELLKQQEELTEITRKHLYTSSQEVPFGYYYLVHTMGVVLNAMKNLIDIHYKITHGKMLSFVCRSCGATFYGEPDPDNIMTFSDGTRHLYCNDC